MTYKANKLDKFRLITEKLFVISIYKDVTLHSRKTIFAIGFCQSCKLDILPKTYQGGTSYIKISIKITHCQLL